MTTLVVSGTLLGMRHFGWMQPLELVAYDQMVRSRPDHPPDPRLLIVAITEKDIQTQQRFPLSDQTIATLLQTLQQHQPTVIGLDLLRDVPQEPGNAALRKQLQAANIIAITGLKQADDYGAPPPPGMPEAQIGFNDVLTDADGVIRRALLFAETDYPFSFAMQLSVAYLQPQGIKPQLNSSDHLTLKGIEFIPLESYSGGYQTIDAAGYQLLLNYRSRRNVARSLTLTQILTGDFDPNWIKNKIVLIGATARSAKDDFLTPFSPTEKETPKMAGVEIHAQIVSQLLSTTLDQQPLFWFWSDWAEIAWIVGWALLGACLARLVRNPLLVGGYVIIAVGVLLGSSYAIFLSQGWVPVATPALGLLLTAGIMVADRARQAQQQQQMMMKLLGQNTSPEIARALWRSRDRLLKSGKLPGQRLTATMLFTDLQNFSTISEQMPPENLLEWLNEYLSAITEEVVANQGIINKFTGDGMLAVFGVPMNRITPVEVSQDAQLAVACALAMGKQLERLNQDWQKRGLPTTKMRVGIFTGPIVAGSLGGKDRLEYGVIGDSVNIAARLESYEKERHPDLCRILIAKETLVHLGDRFEVEPWGWLMLKGRHHAVDVYRVVREKERGEGMGNG
ncbi:MAG: adenylate/guanylate cyclase domain-containing protein [Oscillatoriales cyanobacterium C42_A2020_001]|nr:adenylate/guanylate cyclase domain-containing protein [Leptolyngbyaceae cyanobacterium C42_A2020_001]